MSMNKTVTAHTLYAEARGIAPGQPEIEEWRELFLIASVILERARRARNWTGSTHRLSHPQYGNGELWSACLVPWQFSCWNGGAYTAAMSKLDQPPVENVRDTIAWQRCQAVSATLDWYDNTGQIALFLNGVHTTLPSEQLISLAEAAFKTRVSLYHAKNIPDPSWVASSKVKLVMTAGDHVFYNEEPTLQEASSH